jgi:drug/metabolite transporter (DMT)-like permease
MSPALKKILPYLALMMGIGGLGFSAIFVRWAQAPGAVAGVYRMGLAALVMTLPFGTEARRTWPLSRRHVGLAILAGVFFGGDMFFWNTGALLTSAANSTLFGNTAPFWVGLGTLVLFKEKLRPTFWLGLLLGLSGALLILGGDFRQATSAGWGGVLSLLAGFCYGLFFLATQRAREGLSALTSWWVSAAASTGVLLLAALLLHQPLIGYSANTYWNFMGMALVTQVGGYVAVNYALGHLPASIVSPTLLAQPVLTALLAVPLLDEALSGIQMSGGVLVLGGIWLVHKR